LTSPKYTLNLCIFLQINLLKGGEKFIFMDDETHNQYYIANIENNNIVSSVKIAKSATQSSSTTLPEIGELKHTTEIDSDIIGRIYENGSV